jgi:NMD protein affecting ribosome stability and mRNA decay
VKKVCRTCSAVERDGHWADDPAGAKALRADGGAQLVTCPGCDRIARRRVDGVVVLTSPMLDQHRDEALNLIRNVAERRHKSDVAARIVDIEEAPGRLTVTTTCRHLAERIGKEFEKAHSGSLDIRWPKGEEFVRVSWKRA